MNFATTKERIIQYIDYKGIAIKDFLIKTDIKRGFLDSDKLKSTVSDVFIAKIIAVYPDINVNWLLTGEGDMIKNENNSKSSVISEPSSLFRKTKDKKYSNQEIPLYDFEASAGLKELFDTDAPRKVLDTIRIPNLPKCDGAISVTGDSMYPLLKSGDIILYRETDLQNIFFGEMYLLSVQLNEWEEYITVKYVQRSEFGEDYVKLVSQNQHHQPKDIPINKISALALIKASIRINTMM